MATNLSFPAPPRILRFSASATPATSSPRVTGNITARGMRRVMTRQQGYALETIGHAVDYLNDSYVSDGANEDILDFRSSSIEAVHILIAAQREILSSLPLAEPVFQRFWNAVLHRRPQLRTTGVLPLSTSRL